MRVSFLPSSLEKIIVVFLPALLLHLRSQTVSWLRESSTLVYNGELISNVIMEAIEHDEQDSNSRRKSEKSFFGETVRLQLSILEGSDCILFVLVAAVERREIEI